MKDSNELDDSKLDSSPENPSPEPVEYLPGTKIKVNTFDGLAGFTVFSNDGVFKFKIQKDGGRNGTTIKRLKYYNLYVTLSIPGEAGPAEAHRAFIFAVLFVMGAPQEYIQNTYNIYGGAGHTGDYKGRTTRSGGHDYDRYRQSFGDSVRRRN